MIEKVLQMSKSVDDEKVGVSFQMPKSLKDKIDKLCEKNSIKLTTFFNSLAQVAIDEHYANMSNYDRLRAEEIELELWLENFGGGDPEEMAEYHHNKAQLTDIKIALNKIRG